MFLFFYYIFFLHILPIYFSLGEVELLAQRLSYISSPGPTDTTATASPSLPYISTVGIFFPHVLDSNDWPIVFQHFLSQKVVPSFTLTFPQEECLLLNHTSFSSPFFRLPFFTLHRRMAALEEGVRHSAECLLKQTPWQVFPQASFQLLVFNRIISAQISSLCRFGEKL